MGKNKSLKVQGILVNFTDFNGEDYINITDMLKYNESTQVISKWFSNKNTIEFLGVWEQINNIDFNYTEFGIILNEAGVNRFTMSAKQWILKTKAIGIKAKTGRFGGTYAHKDIAFEFGTWISPTFKLYLINEYQRLKEIEHNQYNLEWDVNRILTKVNYKEHTDAVKDIIIPKSILPEDKKWIEYAKEADLLNVALFGYTAKQWKEHNPTLALKGKNPRDYASINELIILSRLETMNGLLIRQKFNPAVRFDYLRKIAKEQLEKLKNIDVFKSIKKLSGSTYIEATKNDDDTSKFQ